MVRWVAALVLFPVLEQYPSRWNHLDGFLALENIVSRAAYARLVEPRIGSTGAGAALASAQDAFQLPSGNIHCAVFEGTLRCDVLNFTYARPPRPGGCDLDWGGAVELGGKGAAELLCHGDTVADPRHPVLGYGRAWQGPGMACTAAQTGLRCTNADGRGFEMARARLRLF